MKIAFLQMDCHFGKVDENLTTAGALLPGISADLVVLPELFHCGYYFSSALEAAEFAESVPDGRTTQFLIEWAAKKQCHIVAGVAERYKDSLFNSAVLVGPSGFISVYRKIHLFNEEKTWFSPGEIPFFVVDIGSARLGMMICFDWFFPESVRSLALLGADIICHPANLVLPFCQKAMITRCLENRVFAVTANRIGMDERPHGRLTFTGCSQIISPFGEILAAAGKDEESICSIDVNVEQARSKKLTRHNDLFADRRPQYYFGGDRGRD